MYFLCYSLSGHKTRNTLTPNTTGYVFGTQILPVRWTRCSPKTPKGVRRYLSVRQVTMRIFLSDSLFANGQKKSPVFQRCSSINLTVGGQISFPKILCEPTLFRMGFLRNCSLSFHRKMIRKGTNHLLMDKPISCSETSFMVLLSTE